MARRRRLRPQQAGLWYHLGARGIRKLPIVHDDDDRAMFLDRLGDVVGLFGWELTAFCLMTNHYHLVVRTPEPNVAAGMHRLNMVYAQVFNRKHGFAGGGISSTRDSGPGYCGRRRTSSRRPGMSC